MNERPTLSRAQLEAFDSQPEGSGQEKRFRCPFCRASERAFHIHLGTGTFNCKRSSCKAQGLLTDFWRNPPGAARDDAPRFSRQEVQRAQIARAFGLSDESPPNATTEGTPGNWRGLWENAVSIAEVERGTRYLIDERALTLDVASAAGVRFCENWAPSPDAKIYHAGAAVLFPTTGEHGDVVAVSGRYVQPQIGRDQKPIKTRTGGDAKQGVFMAPARIAGQWWNPFDQRLDAVIIVEGQADALSLALCGFPALASNGKNLSPWLHRRAGLRPVLLASDADNGGDEAAASWAVYLSNYGSKCQRFRPEGAKDWNEFLTLFGRDALADFLAVSILMK